MVAIFKRSRVILCVSGLFIYFVMRGVKQLFSYHKVNSVESNNKCQHLYNIAKDMLNGVRIKLPFETKQTKWKFHREVDLGLLEKTSLRWNYPTNEISNKTKRFMDIYKNAKSRNIKSKKYFITFADNCCHRSKIKAVMCALYPGGFHNITVYDLNSLSNGFKKTHSYILSQKRGRGYWLWKPYILLKTLVENTEDGDLLMYQDAGAHIIRDAGPLLKLCQDSKYGILMFYLTLLEHHYTKRDAFVLMDMDDRQVHKTLQRLASFLVIRRNCMSLQFLMEWLAYASDARILTDMENKMGKKNFPEFKEHRHDQSVLSLLSKKWGLEAFRTPSQFGNPIGYRGGPYEQIILHSRARN